MQANRAPIKLIFPLALCFAPAALILLMGPALLDIQDFIQNSDEYLGQSQLSRQIEQLEQPATIDIGRTGANGDLDAGSGDTLLGP